MLSFKQINSASDIPNITDPIFIEVVKTDKRLHPANTRVSMLLIKTISDKPTTFVVPIEHNEFVSVLSFEVVKKWILAISIKKYVLDKKEFLHFFNDETVIDVNLLYFLGNGLLLDDDYDTAAHKFIKHQCYSLPDLNLAIPLLKHIEKFDEIYGHVIKVIFNYEKSYYNESLNNDFMVRLYNIEKQGLTVDPKLLKYHWTDSERHVSSDNKVFTEYNMYTATGRPSNRFGGINYSALTKDDGERACFVSSRLDGYLVYYDYSAFHPRLIATMLDYDLSYDEDVYEYLGKHHFGKNSITAKEKDEIKKIAFKLLYGGITNEYLKVDYFKKIYEFTNSLWEFFKVNGYIETPLLGRKIKTCHIHDAFPSKVFNYMLQAYESEVGSQVIGELQAFLVGKNTKLVLYQYDGFLFDFDKADGKDVLVGIRDIMTMNRTFPVKMMAGKNFQDLVEIGG